MAQYTHCLAACFKIVKCLKLKNRHWQWFYNKEENINTGSHNHFQERSLKTWHTSKSYLLLFSWFDATPKLISSSSEAFIRKINKLNFKLVSSHNKVANAFLQVWLDKAAQSTWFYIYFKKKLRNGFIYTEVKANVLQGNNNNNNNNNNDNNNNNNNNNK